MFNMAMKDIEVRLRSFPRACVICVGSTGAGKSSTISLVPEPHIFILFVFMFQFEFVIIVVIPSRRLAMLSPFLIPRAQSPNTVR